MNNLLTGFRLAFLLPVQRQQFRLSLGAFWRICLLLVLCNFCLSYALSEAPRLFQPEALSAEAFDILALLLTAFCIGIWFRDSRLQFDLSILVLNAAFWLTLCSKLLILGLLPLWLDMDERVYLLAFYGCSFWFGLILLRALLLLTPPAPIARLLSLTALLAISLLPQFYIDLPDFWSTDYDALDAQTAAMDRAAQPAIDAESVLSQQWPMLQQELTALKPSLPGQTDLFFLGFAGDGSQDVFRKEVNFSQQLFDQRFSTQGHSLALINSPNSYTRTPLATATNLQVALDYLGKIMQPDDDILFLFLTSHGSRDHQLSVDLSPLPLNDLPAQRLAQMLDASPLQWQVIVVSACFSGGFIEPLKNDHRLIITAARPDRTSFGCSDDADFTYFGRAYFADALQQTHNFIAAFDIAKGLVSDWEQQDHFQPSEPQIYIGEAMRQKLQNLPMLALHP